MKRDIKCLGRKINAKEYLAFQIKIHIVGFPFSISFFHDKKEASSVKEQTVENV